MKICLKMAVGRIPSGSRGFTVLLWQRIISKSLTALLPKFTR
jgi:hypothetical protein